MASQTFRSNSSNIQQKFVDKQLRKQFTRFLTEPAPWKIPLQEIAKTFRQNDWEAVIFGGVLRDLVLYGPAERPRDVDIVASCSSAELNEWLSTFNCQRTRFGGFRVHFQKWNFDIWPLRDTWAFTTGHMRATFENLPKTTFFNIEAIAAQLNTISGKKRHLYSYGFAEAIASKTLDINFEPNPFPQLCIVRGLLTAARHSFFLSPRLAHYMVEKRNRAEISEIVEAQFKHYGIVRLLPQHIVNWLDHIQDRLKKSPEEAVRLPITAGEQLELPSFDHWQIL